MNKLNTFIVLKDSIISPLKKPRPHTNMYTLYSIRKDNKMTFKQIKLLKSKSSWLMFYSVIPILSRYP